MKKLISLLIFISFYSAVNSQVLKGTIYDKTTKAIIGFASVYFNGTFVGAYTDKDGNFTLDMSKSNSMPLTVSAIGYYSVTITDYSPKKPMTIYLSPKVYEVGEVVVSGKSLAGERAEDLAVFKREFLGATSNARMCEITNESDISFNYGHDRDTLRAYASKPIQIINNALGYRITYYLDKFEYDRHEKTFLFKGNLVFNEDLANDTTRAGFDRKRKNAYQGSRVHFLRTLWADALGFTGFVVRNATNVNLDYKDFVKEDANHNKYLSYPEPLNICYYSKIPTSRITFLKDRVFFNGGGYFDPTGISWDGKMAVQRVGDWLPFEYTPRGK